MVDTAEFKRWRSEADGALRSATREAEANAHNWACFLAEQAAQLGIKALLHGAGLGPWGHDLVELGKAVREGLGAPFPDGVDDALLRLSRHYIPARYPDAHAGGTAGERYSKTDSSQAIEDAERTLAFVDDAWAAIEDATDEA